MTSDQTPLEEFGNSAANNDRNSWEKRELGQVTDINPGSINDSGFNFDEIKYLDISSTGKGFIETLNKYDLDEAPSRAKRTVKAGDTVLSRVRPAREQFVLITNPEPNLVVSTGFGVLRPKEEINDKYLYYAVTTPEMITWMDNHTSGSAYPAVNIGTLKNAEIPVPPIETQEKIGEVLHKIDSKIKTNRRINEILEEMSQALFESWFVEFEPYDEFKQSELGKIPAKFEVKSMSEFSEIILGNSPKSEHYNESGDGLPFFQGSKNFGLRYPDIERWCTKRNKVAKEDDVLLSIRAPVGDVNRTSEKCVVGRGVTALRMSQHDNEFLYHLLKANEQEWEKFKSGTTFNSINKTDIQEFPVAMPPSEEIARFNRVVDPMARIFKINVEENNTLASLRDTLLPKLMSGDLKVNDISLDDLEVDSEV